MKKFLFILATMVVSCNDRQPQEQVQPTVTESSAETISEDIDAKAIEKIQTFYRNYIFGRQEATDSVIAQYCTKTLAQKLRDDYDNEFSEGGGYAIWEFRSGAQDGEDIQEVEKIENLGENRYLVHYNDMGNKGTLTISTIVENNEILFDKLINKGE
ncbi:MAG: hypothetical protein IKK68_07515 [Paludibacteraceae bacterium]|nr:hypothetical protein [Paludibacteraceae bacterium]